MELVQQIIIIIFVISVAFLITSAIIMGLWNSCVTKAFKEGSIRKIDFPTAMGLTLLIIVLPSSSFYVYTR